MLTTTNALTETTAQILFRTALEEIFKTKKVNCVITPHGKNFVDGAVVLIQGVLINVQIHNLVALADKWNKKIEIWPSGVDLRIYFLQR